MLGPSYFFVYFYNDPNPNNDSSVRVPELRECVLGTYLCARAEAGLAVAWKLQNLYKH